MGLAILPSQLTLSLNGSVIPVPIVLYCVTILQKRPGATWLLRARGPHEALPETLDFGSLILNPKRASHPIQTQV